MSVVSPRCQCWQAAKDIAQHRVFRRAVEVSTKRSSASVHPKSLTRIPESLATDGHGQWGHDWDLFLTPSSNLEFGNYPGAALDGCFKMFQVDHKGVSSSGQHVGGPVEDPLHRSF